MRYKALRLTATLFKALAVLIVILGLGFGCFLSLAYAGIIGSGIFEQYGGYEMGAGIGAMVVTWVAIIFYVGIIALSLFVYAEMIHLAIDVEENTRLTAEAVRRLAAGKD